VTYGERDLRAQQVYASVSQPVGRSRLCDPEQPERRFWSTGHMLGGGRS
jgi:hypothetical protein